jgi:peptide/nickel transport system ATP-binding protein
VNANTDPSPNQQAGAGHPVLDIDHLKVTFATDAGDVHAVKDVSLEVRKGEVLGSRGPAKRSPPKPSWACFPRPPPVRALS